MKETIATREGQTNAKESTPTWEGQHQCEREMAPT